MKTPVIPNATFTVSNLLKKTHRTIKVKTVRKGKLKGKRLIELLTGSDNVSSYTGFGFVNDNGTINIWRRHAGSRTMVWLAQYVANQFSKDKKDLDGVEMVVSKNCMRCNRKLTTPESIEAGYGPECITKV